VQALNSHTSVQRVLVIKLGALGDLVFADGALRDIREHHPQAQITLLTRRSFAALMRRCPWVDAVITDDNAPRWRLDRMVALRRLLDTGGYELVYDLQNSRRTRFYRRWLSPRNAVWSQQPRKTGKRGAVTARHAVQLNAAGIAARHANQPSPDWIADDAEPLLREAGVARPFVVLLPGSSARHPHKRWPHYAECSHQLQAQGLNVVTIPGIDEADLGPGFAGIVLKTAGRVLNLHELAGVLKAADTVVGNDSGPTHLAACLGTACVAIFEADSPARISTGIDTRNAICLTAQPLASLPVEATVSAVLRQRALGMA
jgi:ADP-heptose:LPS heptosyltransferase